MYNKLFTKIVDSSIWVQPDHVRIVWMMCLAIMDEDGFVNLASVKNVANRAIVSLENAEDAILVLESPDSDSSNPANEGRRLTRVPGGWIVNNSKEYRDIVKREHQKELNRERVKKHREKHSSTESNGNVTACNASVMGTNDFAALSEAEAEEETKNKKDVSFDSFWEAFPRGRKTGKGKAKAAFLKAIKKVDAETIISAAKEYAASDVGRGQYVKGPEPWLNGECWDDDREAWKDKDDRAPANQDRVIFNKG